MRALLCLIALLSLAGCGPVETSRIADYRTLGELRVATREDIISWRRSEDGSSSGFEHDLLLELGKRLGVPVRFIVYPDVPRALDAVLGGEVHLAAAGLARNERLPLHWSPPLRDVDYVLVGRAESPEIETEADLARRTVSVRRGTVPAEALERMRKRLPALNLHHPARANDSAMLARLAAGQLDLVATDRAHFGLAVQTYPALTVAWDLPISSSIAWALPREGDGGLGEEVAAFLEEAREGSLIARLADRYFTHVRRLSDADVNGFLSRMRERLPRYRKHFQEAQARTGVDWRFLAALAYQESQWDPQATSPTGVRGMMMLTAETADRLGVTDRLDPRESILGGARYYAMLRDNLPDDIAEPDRSWLAIAAYNLGPGHMNGARQIAARMGRDNTDWWEMKKVLPLLARPEYAARLKAGRARGGEAVIMTENVRNYYGILLRLEAPYVPPLEPRLAGGRE